MALEQCRDFREHEIAGGVPRGVVHPLEAVQVDHDHGDANAFARGAQHLAGHVVPQEAPVVEIGQGIPDRLLLEGLQGLRERLGGAAALADDGVEHESRGNHGSHEREQQQERRAERRDANGPCPAIVCHTAMMHTSALSAVTSRFPKRRAVQITKGRTAKRERQ